MAILESEICNHLIFAKKLWPLTPEQERSEILSAVEGWLQKEAQRVESWDKAGAVALRRAIDNIRDY